MPLIAILLAQAFGIGAFVAAVAFWPKIMGWVRAHLLPWVHENLPWLADDLQLALREIDEVMVSIRQSIKAAWRRVRAVLLNEIAEFVRLLDNDWSVRITSWITNRELTDQPYTKIVTEQRLSYDQLPAEVRAAALRDDRREYTVNVTETRDQLLLAAAV